MSIKHTEEDGALLNLLVVDDSMIIRKMVKRTIENAGGKVTAAEDGVIGLNLWKTNRNFNVILTDINMPNMDGYELTRSLREGGFKGVILCLTTESRTDKKEAGRVAGADGWLVKPFEPSALVNTIIKAIEKRKSKGV